MKFQELYNKLNPQQKNAVDAIDGPVMVVAGPGTGKTQILTLRIANIIKKTDTEPENILALTFTESGAASMRKRLVEIVGSAAYSVTITTFHSFCNEVIKTHPEQFPHIIGSKSITEIDQIKIIESVIDSIKLKLLKPYGDPLHYIRPVLTAINTLKREGIDPDKFEQIIKKEEHDFESIEDLIYDKGAYKGKMKGKYQKLQEKIFKNKELAEIYKEYQNQLIEQKLYDYSDMIMEVVNTLSQNHDLLLILQEQFQYILVDEHQDTNNAQNKILELLCNFYENPNLFVVGDEKQAIFRFQGASLENFLYFKKLYPQAQLIILEENYRSTQAILDSAHSLLSGPKKLNANTKHKDNKIKLYSFSRPEIENYFIANDIKEKINNGAAAEEIAVLYRENRDAFEISKMLEKFSIPFIIESDQNILTDNDIKKLILLLNCINSLGDQALLIESMHIDFLEIEPLDIYKLIEYANSNKQSVFSIIKSKEILDSLKLETADKIENFVSYLSSWKTLSKNKELLAFFEIFIRESGFLAYIMSASNSVEKLDKLNGFFDEMKELVENHKNYGLNEFIEYLQMLDVHNILLKKSSSTHPVGMVRLMTAHRSKGQEFEYVYIINAFNGHWGNKRKFSSLQLPPAVFALTGNKLEEGDENDDERRLFYVALTRAKKEITVTYSKESQDKKEQLLSQFLEEINPDLIEIINTEKYENDFSKEKNIIFKQSEKIAIDIKSKEFIRELFLRNGLSVTGLNNYLDCPWKYFYTNLLRIPKAMNKHQMYGVSVHAALKDFFDSFKEQTPTKEFLLQKFNYYLSRQPFSEKDFEESYEKGIASLGGYFDFYKNDWRINSLNELNVSGIMLTEDIRLVGKIDKIEVLNGSNEVNVVDYKTSKPKTKGVIEGSTKSSDGGIKRQLVFYKILLDDYANGKFKMISGDIDFIEPDEKGRYKKESFMIEKEEINELKEIIKTTSDEILNISFWDKRCKTKDCEYCALRRLGVASE